jgi:hypothetical protein
VISENARGAIWPLGVLTGSLSWDLESSCLFDHVEVGCDLGDTLTAVRHASNSLRERKGRNCTPASPEIRWKCFLYIVSCATEDVRWKATRRTHTREVSGGERSDTGVPQAITGFLYYPQSEVDESRGPRILKRISVMGKGIVENQESRCAHRLHKGARYPMLAYSCRLALAISCVRCRTELRTYVELQIIFLCRRHCLQLRFLFRMWISDHSHRNDKVFTQIPPPSKI